MGVKFKQGDTVKIPKGCIALISSEQGTVLFEPVEPEIDIFKDRYIVDTCGVKETSGLIMNGECSSEKLAIAWEQLSRLSLYAREYLDENKPIKCYLSTSKQSGEVGVYTFYMKAKIKPLCFNSTNDANRFIKRFKKELELAKPLL